MNAVVRVAKHRSNAPILVFFISSHKMHTNRLTSVTNPADLSEMRDLYKKDWPRHSIGYYTLQNYLNWMSALQPEKLQHTSIFTLNKDWRIDGLYLIVDRYQLFVNALNTNGERLSQALKLIDWSKGYKITAIPAKYYSTVVSHVKELQLEWTAAMLVIYYMPQATALKLRVDCPAGFQLRPLNIRDAALLDELWPNRHEGSLFFIKRLIELNPSMGLYRRDNQELVAWCTRCQAGFLGTLQVKNSYKRRGFASLVVKAFALHLAKIGQDILSLAYEHNTASHQLFLKLGFEAFANAHHMKAFHSKKGIEWSEDA